MEAVTHARLFMKMMTIIITVAVVLAVLRA